MRHSLRAYQYTVGSSLPPSWRTLTDPPPQEIAPACLCLALKVEERTNIKIHYVARATKAKLDVNNDHVRISPLDDVASLSRIPFDRTKHTTSRK